MSAISGMLNIFVDPAASIPQIHRKASWVWPLLLVSAVTIAIGMATMPLVLRIFAENPPAGLSGDQLERSIGMIAMVQKIGVFFSPLLVAVPMAINAGLILMMCSVLDLPAKFRDLFSLLAHCSLIVMVQAIAGFIVIRAKGSEIDSLAQLQPAFGLDLLFHDGLNKQLLALLNYFSIFRLWHIAVLTVGLAHLVRTSKGKAFFAATPGWLVPLLFVLVGSVFGR